MMMGMALEMFPMMPKFKFGGKDTDGDGVPDSQDDDDGNESH